MFTLPGAAAKETTTPAREQYIRLTHCLEERLSRCLGPAWIICGLDVLVGRWSDHVLAAGCVRSLKSHRAGFRYGQSTNLINHTTRGDRPELLDAVGADADVPVVEVDGRVAVAGDQADLVAEPKAVGGGRDGEAAVLVGGALVGRGGLVANERGAGIEGERLEASVDDGTVRGWAAHRRRPDEDARLE